LLDQDDCRFYDSRESFSDSAEGPDLNMKSSKSCKDNCRCVDKFLEPRDGVGNSECIPLSLKRRTQLPKPVDKEKGVSLWSLIKDNVGKDMTSMFACLL
jgi:oxysterol-binding protein 1